MRRQSVAVYGGDMGQLVASSTVILRPDFGRKISRDTEVLHSGRTTLLLIPVAARQDSPKLSGRQLCPLSSSICGSRDTTSSGKGEIAPETRCWFRVNPHCSQHCAAQSSGFYL